MITVIDDYFSKGCGRCDRFETPECSTQKWHKGLAELRRICQKAKLSENVKWGHPCYMHQDRNIALLGAFRGDFRITFFNPSLMKDPEGVLEKTGPNGQHPSMIRFAKDSDVKRLEKTIQAYLLEAIGYANAGIKPAKVKVAIELPLELSEALDADPELAEAFHDLTPGRQRSYVINLNGAKKSETRRNRIEKFRDKIIARKGAMER